MEVEAKFTVADGEVLARLAETAELAGYALEAGVHRYDRDTFLDTADRRFLGAGYYLRRRETDDGVRLTLKQLLTDAGGVLRREELEALVAADVPLAEWPRGALRERVERLSAGASLEPFLTLEQERLARRVRDGSREVAELSLDHVSVASGARLQRWYEIELELRGEGHERDLEKLLGALRAEPGLTPESRAKFARALAMVEAGEEADVVGEAPMPAGEAARPAGRHVRLLPPAERAFHERLAAEKGTRGRRALALLALDDGLTQAAAGARAGLSSRRVRYWLARYRAEGAGVYGRDVVAAAAAGGVTAGRGRRRPSRSPSRSPSRLPIRHRRWAPCAPESTLPSSHPTR